MEIIQETIKQLYIVLSSNTDVPVYSHVPKGSNYPYIKISEVECQKWGFDGGYNIVYKVEYISDETSNKLAIQMLDDLYMKLYSTQIKIKSAHH